MQFVSHRQFVEDVRTWSAELPGDLIAVAGVPRSGILAAVHLALHRNLHLVSVEELIQGKTPWRHSFRRGVPGRREGRILVMEDSVNTGGTIRAVRQQLKGQPEILYGAVYATEPLPELDFMFRQVSLPRCFEWNLFYSQQLEFACVDMDGVLCADWTGMEDDSGPGWNRYHEHLRSALPRFLPTTYRIAAIVTSRLEKYRTQTVNWLRRHGVRFGELLMSPHPSAAVRRAAGDHARRKAGWYTRRPDARLFIESQIDQAKEIARITERPVLCTDAMQLFSGRDGQPVAEAVASLRDSNNNVSQAKVSVDHVA